MKHTPVSLLRDARYALPGLAGRALPSPGPAEAARLCAGLAARGMASVVGYFQADDAAPETIVAAYREVAALLAAADCEAYLSVKAPPLGFDPGHLGAIAAAGLPLLFDAQKEEQAQQTLALALAMPETGMALPARWRRSAADAAALCDGPGRIRLVKGEWADPAGDVVDVAANYLALAARLAGRKAPVAVATHDPDLAEAALTLLKAAGTPGELEQLRGLPRKRTLAVARRLEVPVRIYCPFGPGWWPYAIDKALGRPYLPLWAVKDWMG
ncbi:MAG: proline dehydrogenase [Novosphingobium sp.]|uniref:proline dehydrogenase n=1 Tax=Novosphingobium sp. TaxID=1874826 RepID=UPI001D2AD348|nr:proline dehydrogenase [Novosphingobium sp.]MCB2058268.1 proline dehydrogenase [Novosphingobium sp.]MCP5387097.1 proline dehydrogenase [Novosphingobium sp.]